MTHAHAIWNASAENVCQSKIAGDEEQRHLR